jgi:HTH-type transcriptional regulator/antitoxin HigA
MKYESPIESFKTFSDPLKSILHIKNESDYQDALNLVEELFDESEDREDDPISPLIDMVAASIERYESKDPELVKFVSDSEEIPKDIALVNVLIDQYKLTLSDLLEIGDKSTVVVS